MLVFGWSRKYIERAATTATKAESEAVLYQTVQKYLMIMRTEIVLEWRRLQRLTHSRKQDSTQRVEQPNPLRVPLIQCRLGLQTTSISQLSAIIHWRIANIAHWSRDCMHSKHTNLRSCPQMCKLPGSSRKTMDVANALTLYNLMSKN